MDKKKTRYAHYNLNYHLVWIPKYRRKTLGGEVKNMVECASREKGDSLGVEILELMVMDDHVHLFVSAPPWFSPSELVGQFKGYSSRKTRIRSLRFRSVNRQSLWTDTYNAGTAGTVSSETIKRYISNQEHP